MCPHKWPCKRNAPAWKQSYFLKAVFLRPPLHEHTRIHTHRNTRRHGHTPGHMPQAQLTRGSPAPLARPQVCPRHPDPPSSPSASKQLLTWVRQSGEYITAGRWGVRVRLGVRFGGVRECG